MLVLFLLVSTSIVSAVSKNNILERVEQLEVELPKIPDMNIILQEATPQRDEVINECGIAINEPGEYTLEEDIVCPDDLEIPAITINVNDVTLDCSDYNIMGPGDLGIDDPIHGIYLEGLNGIIITNCEISGFNEGISFNNIEESEIINNNLNSNNNGIYLHGSNSNTITNNMANENGIEEDNDLGVYGGIQLYESNSNTITGNIVNENGNPELPAHGIGIRESDSNVITNNIANNNNQHGIVIHHSSNNDLRSNIANDNIWDGIMLTTNSNNNYLTNNTANNNNFCGIWVISNSGNTLIRNIVNNNNEHGIALLRSSNNNLISNTIEDTSWHAVMLHDSDSNILIDNIVNENGYGIWLGEDSNSNNMISNTFCYNDESDIGLRNGEDNEFLYTQCDNMEGVDIDCMPCDIESFEINLRRGWNMISSPRIPHFPVIEAIFGGLARREIVEIVKDENGDFYVPEWDFDGIGDWEPEEGYMVKVTEDIPLRIYGDELVDADSIEVNAGWNYRVYPRFDALPMDGENGLIQNVFRPLVERDNLLLVKNDEGQFYAPEFNFNNIPGIASGEGFLIKVERDDVLNFDYEINHAPVCEIPEDVEMPLVVEEDNELELNLDVYCHDPDDDELGYEVLELRPDEEVDVQQERNMLIVSFQENWNGDASVTVQASDGGLESEPLEITIMVVPVNDAPYIEDCPDQVIDEDAIDNEISVDLWECSGDVDNRYEELEYMLGQDNQELIGCEINENQYVVCDDPAENANGVNEITVTVADPDGANDSDTMTITVEAIDDPCVWSEEFPDEFAIDEDSGRNLLIRDLREFASDVDNEFEFSVTVNPMPDNYETYIEGNRRLGAGTILEDYSTPEDEDEPEAEITCNEVPRRFRLRVLPVNDAPYILNCPDEVIDEDAVDNEISIDLWECSGDVDNDYGELEYMLEQDNQELIDCEFSENQYVVCDDPAENANGVNEITVTVADPDGANDSDTMTITVLPVDDGPCVWSEDFPDEFAIDEDSGRNVLIRDLREFAFDVDNEFEFSVAVNPMPDNYDIYIMNRWLRAMTVLEDYFTPEDEDEPEAEITCNEVPRRFRLRVLPVNDAPYIGGYPDEIIQEDAVDNEIEIDLWEFSGDADDRYEELEYVLLEQANQELIDCYLWGNRYVLCDDPAENAYGINNIAVGVTDPEGLHAEGVVRIVVEPVNDAPFFIEEIGEITLPDDYDGVIDFSVYAADIDGDQLRCDDIDGEHALIEFDGNCIGRVFLERNWLGEEELTLTVRDNEAEASQDFVLIVYRWTLSWSAKRSIELLNPPDYVMVNASQVIVDLFIDDEQTFFPCTQIGNDPTDFTCLRLTEDDHRIEYQFLNTTYGNTTSDQAQYLMFFPSTYANNSFKDYAIYYVNETPVTSAARTLLDIYEPFEGATGIDGYKDGDEEASIDNGVLNILPYTKPFWRFDEISTEASYTFEVKLSECMGNNRRCLIILADETPDRGEYYEKGIYVVIDEYDHREVYAFFNNRENTLCEDCVEDNDKLKFDCDRGGCWMYIGDNEEAEETKIQYRGTDDVSGWNMLLVGNPDFEARTAQIDDLKLSAKYNFTTYREEMNYELGEEIEIEG